MAKHCCRKSIKGCNCKLWKGKAWRSPTGYQHDSDTTAGDVVRYEQEELGNNLSVTLDTLKYLDEYPATSLIWVTRKISFADKYGNPKEVQLSIYTEIIAEDGEGGYLVLDPRNKSESVELL
jgi:hypothetical protein